MFNLLTDTLPVTVIIGDIEYPINWDAKTILKISNLIEGVNLSSISDEEYSKIAVKQMELFYPATPHDLQGAMKQLIGFYTQSIDEYAKPKTNGNAGGFERSSYSFKYDAHLIYAAFIQQYPSVSLDNLHWFEFKALLEGLTEDCLFVKVTQWRARKIDNKMPKEDRKFYRRMKQMYALPDKRTQEQKDADFARALFNL